MSEWFDKWREAYDSNEQLLKELSEYPDGYHKSLLADVLKRKRFLILALQNRENRG